MPVSVIGSVRATQLSVCLVFDKVFDAAQALERIKPFLDWLYLSLSLWPSLTPSMFLPASPVQQKLLEHFKHALLPPLFRCEPTNYFYQKICASLLDHQRTQKQGRLLRVSRTIKENKKRQPVLIPSLLAIARGLWHDPDGPRLCFSV